jgi:hypothetical protein
MIVEVHVCCRKIDLSFSAFYLYSLMTVINVDLLKYYVDHIKNELISLQPVYTNTTMGFLYLFIKSFHQRNHTF